MAKGAGGVKVGDAHGDELGGADWTIPSHVCVHETMLRGVRHAVADDTDVRRRWAQASRATDGGRLGSVCIGGVARLLGMEGADVGVSEDGVNRYMY